MNNLEAAKQMMDEQKEQARRRKNREAYADAYAQLTKTIQYPKGAQPAKKGLNNFGALDGDPDQIVAYAQAELEKLKLLDPDEYAGKVNPHAGKPSGALGITSKFIGA
jgi:hypothetical protein